MSESQERIEQWKKDEAAPFAGWDFSYIKDRKTEEKPPWDYVALAQELVSRSSAVLDMATGGGEVFASLAPFPKRAVAIEGYTPNVAVAAKRLEPLGVEVLEADAVHRLPFDDGSFDLVLNRHGGLNPQEIARVLTPGGFLLTQQVGGDNLADLMAAFGVTAQWPENVLPIVSKSVVASGFELVRGEEWKGKVVFKDVGAVVYFLRAVPWIVEGFRVATHLSYLEKLQEQLEREGELVFVYTRFLIHARKI